VREPGWAVGSDECQSPQTRERTAPQPTIGCVDFSCVVDGALQHIGLAGGEQSFSCSIAAKERKTDHKRASKAGKIYIEP
jgi:hypothetical protein